MLTYVLFLIGFVLLIKGADLLVDGAASVAKKIKVSDIVIGLTIVSFGTSAPELFVNIFASFEGSPEIAIGNILGSNIANILLILGVSAMIYPLVIKSNTINRELPYSLLAVLVLGLMANDKLIDGAPSAFLSRSDGLVMLAFFGIFMYYAFSIAKKDYMEDEDVKMLGTTKSIIYIIGGLIGLGFGAEWIVDGAVKLANVAGVSESLIALTIISIGTSLPELATSAVAAYKRKADIAVGNVVGSNIFNLLWVLGLSAAIKPLTFQPKSNVDIGMTLVATFLLFIFVFLDKKHTLQRWQGIAFFIIYAGYLILLVVLEQFTNVPI